MTIIASVPTKPGSLYSSMTIFRFLKVEPDTGLISHLRDVHKLSAHKSGANKAFQYDVEDVRVALEECRTQCKPMFTIKTKAPAKPKKPTRSSAPLPPPEKPAIQRPSVTVDKARNRLVLRRLMSGIPDFTSLTQEAQEVVVSQLGEAKPPRLASGVSDVAALLAWLNESSARFRNLDKVVKGKIAHQLLLQLSGKAS